MEKQTLDIITWAWIGLGILSFLALRRVSAPYGRHIRQGWGPMLDNKLGWVVQEVPSLIAVSLSFFLGGGVKNAAAWFLWAIWVLHYINRSFIYPLRTRTTGAKIPLTIVAFATCFNLVNGYLNGTFLGNFGSVYGSNFFTSPQFIVGFSLFLAGAFINNQSDTILINLRKPGESGYKIPQGGMFSIISCPNLFGEIVEWIGFAVMCGSLQSWSFAIWVAINLLPRALEHHKWYQEKFSEYPKQRKALIPFVL